MPRHDGAAHYVEVTTVLTIHVVHLQCRSRCVNSCIVVIILFVIERRYLVLLKTYRIAYRASLDS